MPIVVSPQGWVKVPKQAASPRRGPPPDPVEVFRGPLEYFAGRREAKPPPMPPPQPFPPARRRRQLLLEAAPREEIPAPALRAQKQRVASEPAPRKHKSKHRSEVFEVADEEIIREDLHEDAKSVYSRRSASPTRKHRHASSRHDDHRHSSSSRPAYESYHHPYPPHPYPPMQPIAIYCQAPPMGFGGGFGGQYFGGGAPPVMIQGPEYVRERSPKPKPAPSMVSSASSKNSDRSGSQMSYKWYNATQPLKL